MKVKNILLCIALASGVFFPSCSDFLDEEVNPNALSPVQFWQNEEDIMKGLTSVYASLQPNRDWAASYERFIVVDNYRSDEVTFRDDVRSWMDIAMFINDPTNGVTTGEWQNLYKGINYANQCIDNIPKIPEKTEDIKNKKTQGIAEARFLRAYFYYRLYLNYGERVPIYLHELSGTDEEFYPKQAEPGELVKLIETELTEIQNSLPETYKPEEGGRATRYTAAAILGKFYMFRGQLDKAEAEFKKIIDKGDKPDGTTGELFGLMENWEENFNGKRKNSRESIFEIQFTGNKEGGHSEHNQFTEHLAPNCDGCSGYEEAYPTKWLFDVMMTDKEVDDAGIETGKYSVRTLNTLIFDDPDCRPFYYADGKSFADYHLAGKYYWHKYVSWEEGESSAWWYSAFNIPVVRYADVLLLYAECLNDRGQTQEAIRYINQVRKRAHVKQLPLTMGKEAVLKHLQDVERPCELALEGVRWYDLIRWGITEQTLKAHEKPRMDGYVDAKHKLFPIPHAEFLLNPDWVQNPNFSK